MSNRGRYFPERKKRSRQLPIAAYLMALVLAIAAAACFALYQRVSQEPIAVAPPPVEAKPMKERPHGIKCAELAPNYCEGLHP